MSNGKTIRDAMKAAGNTPKRPNPYKHDVIYDPRGQWEFPGQVTRIPGGDITMQGVNYPVYGEDDQGYGQMMYPGMDYSFPGQYVTEYPMAQNGKQVENRTLWGVGSQFIPGYEAYLDWKNIASGVKTGNKSDMYTGIIGVAAPFSGKALGNTLDYATEKTLGKKTADYNQKKREDIVNMSQHDREKLFLKYGHGGYDAWAKDGFPELAYGGDPSLPAITGHYPFGGMYSKTHTHMQDGGWLDQYDEGGEKPWGEMTPKERAAYLDAKEKKKPVTKAEAAVLAKQAEAKSRAQAKKEYYEDYVREGTKKALTHPLLNFPTSFIPEGMAIQMLQSAANYPMHLANDQYGMAALDLAGAIPFSGRLAQTVKGAGKKVIPAATKQVEKLFKAPTFLQSVDDLKTLKTSNKFKTLNTGQAYFQKLGAESLQEALTKRNVNLQSVNDIYETLGSDAEKTKFLNHLYDVVQGSKVEKAVRSADEVLGSIAGTVLGRDATAPDLQTVVNAANKKLAKGLGIKKGDMPISLEVNKNQPYQVDVKLGDTRTGYLNLSPVGTKDSKLSQILKGEKPKMAKNYSDYLNFVNAPKPGFAKSADFPFDYTNLQAHPYKDINLKGQGYSAELNEAINQSLKERGARLYSGSTGHTEEGAARYANLLQKGLVENISPRIPGSYNLKYPENPLYMYKKYGGWLDELDEEYRRGGSVNPLMRSRSKRSTTKKNIQSSINKIFLRNYDLFGPGGKNIYDPKSKYQQGGDWLDNLD